MGRRRIPKPVVAVVLVAATAGAGTLGVWLAVDPVETPLIQLSDAVNAHRESPADRALRERLNRGGSYVSFAIDGPALGHTEPIQLGFAGHSITPSVACNSMNGEVVIDDGRLEVPSLLTTDMACRNMRQEGWLAELLGEGVNVRLEGDVLSLRSGEVLIQLRRQPESSPNLGSARAR